MSTFICLESAGSVLFGNCCLWFLVDYACIYAACLCWLFWMGSICDENETNGAHRHFQPGWVFVTVVDDFARILSSHDLFDFSIVLGGIDLRWELSEGCSRFLASGWFSVDCCWWLCVFWLAVFLEVVRKCMICFFQGMMFDG